MPRNYLPMGAACAFAIAAPQAAHAQIIVNGGFESATASAQFTTDQVVNAGWISNYDNGNGVYALANNLSETANNSGAHITYNSHSGNYLSDITGSDQFVPNAAGDSTHTGARSSGVHQTVSLNANRRYDLTFYLGHVYAGANSQYQGAASLNLYIGTGSTTGTDATAKNISGYNTASNAVFDNKTYYINTYTNSDNSGYNSGANTASLIWKQFTYSIYTTSAAKYTLDFQSASPQGQLGSGATNSAGTNYVGLDDVSLTDISAAPEVSPIALLALGLLPLGIVAYRRQRTVVRASA